MGSSVPPRSIHRIHATTHGATRSQRLALTSPWSPLQHAHSRSVSYLHQSSDLPLSLPALGHRRAVGRNHSWRQGWTGVHGGSRRLSLDSRSDGIGCTLNFSGSNIGRLFKHSSSTSRFSLIAAATGPVASDLLPLFLRASSPTDPAFIQSVTLTLVRNAGLIFAIVTISGRAASLIWQGSIDLVKYVFVLIHGKHGLRENRSIVDRPVLKTAIVLLMLLPIFGVSHYGITSPPFQAAVPGPYQQRLDIALGMLGAPNTTLQLTNLDLSSKGLVQDNNYAGANVAAFIVNNNDSQALGNGQQNQMLQTLSQPALVTVYSGDPKTTAAESAAVEAQFSQALGVPFTTIFSLPMSGQGTATIYAPNPELSNYDALTKLMALLPSQSFSNLINPANIQNMKYFAAIGVVPITVNGVSITGFSFDLNVQFPRQFFKGGAHQLDLKTLLGFQNNIVGD